jgi:6-phosphogluconolactonase
MHPTIDLHVLDDASHIGAELTRQFERAYQRSVSERRQFTCALTGGSGAQLYPALQSLPVLWSLIDLYWGDERAVPWDHPDSNYSLALSALITPLALRPDRIHRMPADASDLEAAARAYEQLLPPHLDLVHLGLGEDGHVASLFPRHPLLAERHARVRAIHDAAKPPARRLTLTLPALKAASKIVITASGKQKAGAVRAALQGTDESLPGVLVARGSTPVVFLIDREAAALLDQKDLPPGA